MQEQINQHSHHRVEQKVDQVIAKGTSACYQPVAGKRDKRERSKHVAEIVRREKFTKGMPGDRGVLL